MLDAFTNTADCNHRNGYSRGLQAHQIPWYRTPRISHQVDKDICAYPQRRP